MRAIKISTLPVPWHPISKLSEKSNVLYLWIYVSQGSAWLVEL